MIFKYKNGGLTCNKPIKGITNELFHEEEYDFYGNKYFICESLLNSEAAKEIAKLINQFIVTLGSDKIIEFNFVEHSEDEN